MKALREKEVPSDSHIVKNIARDTRQSQAENLCCFSFLFFSFLLREI